MYRQIYCHIAPQSRANKRARRFKFVERASCCFLFSYTEAEKSFNLNFRMISYNNPVLMDSMDNFQIMKFQELDFSLGDNKCPE